MKVKVKVGYLIHILNKHVLLNEGQNGIGVLRTNDQLYMQNLTLSYVNMEMD